jgi:hypothetical protein
MVGHTAHKALISHDSQSAKILNLNNSLLSHLVMISLLHGLDILSSNIFFPICSEIFSGDEKHQK